MEVIDRILDQKDGGMSSRKWLFAIGTSLLIFAGAFIAAHWPGFAENYQALIGGLLGSLGLYLGGNVGSQWVAGKHGVAVLASGAAGPGSGGEGGGEAPDATGATTGATVAKSGG